MSFVPRLISHVTLVGVWLLLATACGAPPESYTVAADGTPTDYPQQSADGASWPGWGGAAGDFVGDDPGLAANWPDAGPPLLWSRALGGGYSAIVATDGALFTMYRSGKDDVVIALRQDSGETIWEQRYPAPPRDGNTTQFGEGPNASPLILGDRLITLGFTGVLNALDLRTGAVLWSHDLVEDFGGEVLDFGTSASPIAHDGQVIVLAGGERQGALALDAANGSVVWRGSPSSVSYATPIVIDVDGQEQLVYFSADEVIGLEASTGKRLWSFPCENQYRNNATNLHWSDTGLLWVATQLDGGTRALKLTRVGDATRVDEVWSSTKLSIHFWNTLLLDGHVYGSIGGNASIIAGIELATGEVLWRERGFEQANWVQAGERSILLDKNGHLALTRLSPQGLVIEAQSQIVEGPAWTVPTLVGTRLFVRDLDSIRALELGG